MSILIVDDSDFIHSQLKVLLSAGGHTDLHFAFCAEEAFASLGITDGNDTGYNSDIDLVLMDLVMPGIDGIGAVRKIRNTPATTDLPVIMITAETSRDTLRTAFSAGASDYLSKPVNKVELLARVDSAIRLKKETDRRMAHERELIRQGAELQHAFERIEGEMDLVAKLQGYLLPRNAPNLEGIRVDTLYHSSGRASGDYYDYMQAGPDTMRLIVADVSGHGAQAAFIMAIVRTLLHAGTKMGMTLEAILSLVNSHLCGTTGEEGHFVTVFAADLDLARGQMHYISAGHCPCLLFNGLESGTTIQQLPAMTPPVGLRECSYRTNSLALSSTGKLFLYTDGLYEWPLEPGRIFGLEPFILLCEQLLPVEDDFLGEVERSLRTLTGKKPEFTDDLTALLVNWDIGKR